MPKELNENEIEAQNEAQAAAQAQQNAKKEKVDYNKQKEDYYRARIKKVEDEWISASKQGIYDSTSAFWRYVWLTAFSIPEVVFIEAGLKEFPTNSNDQQQKQDSTAKGKNEDWPRGIPPGVIPGAFGPAKKP